MTAIYGPLKSNLNGNQSHQNTHISKIQAFIISRVGQLKEHGWTTKQIAEALGVSEDFIEYLAYNYSH